MKIVTDILGVIPDPKLSKALMKHYSKEKSAAWGLRKQNKKIQACKTTFQVIIWDLLLIVFVL